MSYKNDDLDKLFRKAARNYPLNTDNADWEKLSQKLANSKKKSGRNNRKYVIAFLLPAFIVSALLVYQLMNDNETVRSNTQREALTTAIPTQKKMHQSASNAITEKHSINSVPENITYSNNNYLSAKTTNVTNYTVTNSFKIAPQIAVNVADDNTILQIQTKQINTNIVTKLDEVIVGNVKQENEDNDAGAETKVQQALTHVQLKPVRRIYGVLFGGPEFSVVKFQKATNPGYKIGVALGYKINDRFDIEIGLQREQLNFYSNGKYIDTSLLRMKRNTNVEKANASSKTTSVPLTIRYNFLSNSNSRFFAAAGINGVMITHSEHYDYGASKNGVESSLSKKYSSLTNPKYFSGISVSAGYQTKVNGSWSMKIEPYYQAPVNDFGVARVPVSNFGIDIGIVKDLK